MLGQREWQQVLERYGRLSIVFVQVLHARMVLKEQPG
jgi:hypothetical protein